MKEKRVRTKKNKDIIWAPWRVGYIAVLKRNDGCFLCKALKAGGKDADRKNLVLYRGKTAFVILNLYPYNNGHMLIVPNRHIKDIEMLKADEDKEVMYLIKASVKILKKAMMAQGFNAGINLNEAGGAGLKSHIHFHLTPRWAGDTNFMPAVCDSKVISQSLQATYKLLRKEFDKLASSK